MWELQPARTDYARADQLQDSTLSWGGTSTGSSNTYALTLVPAITAYPTGMRVRFIANHASTGAATLNIDSVGAVAIKRQDGSTALAAGDIISGDVIEVIHDGTNWRLLGRIISPFIPWTAWTPSLGGEGGLTWSVSSTNCAYCKIGQVCFN